MKREVIKTPYYDKFACKGPDCKYNCCKEWGITVTRDEYNNILKADKSDELQSIVEANFKRIGKGGSYKKYSKVEMDSTYSCGCLASDGLCRLHSECGHEVLPIICKIFPRSATIYDTRVERTLSSGCERVVELLIEEKNSIILNNTIEDVDSKNIIPQHIINAKLMDIRPVFNYYYDIKILSLAIMQNRDYTINQRILLLGMALQKVDKLEKQHMNTQIPEYINEFLNSLENEKISFPLDNLSKNNSIRVLNAIFLIDRIKENNTEFLRMIDIIFENLGVEKKESNIYVDNSDKEHSKLVTDKEYHLNNEKYLVSKKRFDDFIKEKEYIIENIMVNVFLYNGHPFYNPKRSIWDNYIYFANCYNTIKCGIMGYLTETSTMEDFVHCITVLSRKLLHSTLVLFDQVVDEFIKNESDSLAHMAILIL